MDKKLKREILYCDFFKAFANFHRLTFDAAATQLEFQGREDMNDF